jgi:hypothetical protein
MRIAAALFLLAFQCAQLTAAAGPAAETSAVAKLKDVKGGVLVSKTSGLAAGTEGMRLAVGTRVITTSDSHAQVVYDDGCHVSLEPNQRFQVERGRTCEALALLPESIVPAPAAVTASATGTQLFVQDVMVPALAAVGIAELLRRHDDRAVSPN